MEKINPNKFLNYDDDFQFFVGREYIVGKIKYIKNGSCIIESKENNELCLLNTELIPLIIKLKK